jgi:hypothetical protein
VLAGDANAPLEHAARRLGEALENLQIEHLTPYEAHIRQTVARERLPRLIEVFARAEGTALEFSYKAGVRMDGAASISSAPGASDQAATLPPAATPEEALRAAARAAEVAAMHPSADDPAAPADADRQPREFLWFRLLDATAEGLHGELVSTPNHIENLVPGDARYHAPADVADWLIRLEDGTTFGPGDVTLLNYVASRLKA